MNQTAAYRVSDHIHRLDAHRSPSTFRVRFEHCKTGLFADVTVRALNSDDAQTKASESLGAEWLHTYTTR